MILQKRTSVAREALGCGYQELCLNVKILCEFYVLIGFR